MIVLRQVQRIAEVPEGVVNAVSWFPNNKQTFSGLQIRSYELSPYHLRDESGCLMENIWQSSKIYPTVRAQRQIKGERLIWEHPAEVHLDRGTGQPTAAYWAWREKLRRNPQPVRYPNGFAGRHEVLCCLWPDASGIWQRLGYVQARQEIYASTYARLVLRTSAFAALLTAFRQIRCLEIADVDVPESVVVSPQTYQQYLQDTSRAFGHVWTLSLLLLTLA